MTPKIALNILDQAAAMARLTREEHVRVQEAMKFLQPFLTEKPAEPPPQNEPQG